jgi:CO/xanthine dehydrogenase Mo-binding subunit
VVAVLAGADIRDLPDVPAIPLPFAKVPPYPPLARDRVASLDEPIVAIVAETTAQVRDAAELVEVEYEPLPSVASAEDALRPDAPRVHPELDSNVWPRRRRTRQNCPRAKYLVWKNARRTIPGASCGRLAPTSRWCGWTPRLARCTSSASSPWTIATMWSTR